MYAKRCTRFERRRIGKFDWKINSKIWKEKMFSSGLIQVDIVAANDYYLYEKRAATTMKYFSKCKQKHPYAISTVHNTFYRIYSESNISWICRNKRSKRKLRQIENNEKKYCGSIRQLIGQMIIIVFSFNIFFVRCDLHFRLTNWLVFDWRSAKKMCIEFNSATLFCSFHCLTCDACIKVCWENM